MPSPDRQDFLSRVLNLRPGESPAVAAGLAMFFLLFTAYFMLRPVRETMGVAGGVDNLQWLFTGTFIATLAALPLFGWVASAAPRRHLVSWASRFFALILLGFPALLWSRPARPWALRAFCFRLAWLHSMGVCRA